MAKIKAIESDLYRIEKAVGYDGQAVKIILKETDEYIVVYISELEELFGILSQGQEILK